MCSLYLKKVVGRSHKLKAMSFSDRDAARCRKSCVRYVAGIQDAGWFKEQDLCFSIRACAMLHSSRHHNTLSRAHINDSVAKLNPESPLPHHKKLVLVVMMMPGELPLYFYNLDLLAVQSGNHFGSPVLAEQSKLLIKIDLRCHGKSLALLQNFRHQMLRGFRVQRAGQCCVPYLPQFRHGCR